jgi:Uma2 family endonuclease
MTVDEFLVAYEGREGDWEIEDGLVIEIAPETLGYARARIATVIALSDAIQRSQISCEALIHSIAVRITEHTAYIPDALVYCGQCLPPDAREVSDPVIVAEVASPQTWVRQVRRKREGYFSRASVRHYLSIEPQDRSVLHYRRDEIGNISLRPYCTGLLRLDPPGLDLKVEDLFGEA